MPRTLDDLDDDLNLPQRGRRPDTRDDISREMSHDADREFTLSTGTVLALFFTLALICAVFFGFGYSMGRKSAKPADAATIAVPDTTAPREESADKPSAAAPAIPVPSYQADPASRPSPAVKTTTSSDGSRVTIATVPAPAATPKPARTEGEPTTAPVVKTTPAPPAPQQTTPALANSGDPGAVYVQIAAVSHQEDANVLLSALKRRGYSVFTRTSPGDKLIHVQVGPYSGKKDAEVMRQRLLGDGYNAILK